MYKHSLFIIILLLMCDCNTQHKQYTLPPVITDRGIVFMGQEGTDYQSCAFPAICVMPGGRWLSAFRAAPMKTPTEGQHVLLTWSDDEGKSWCEPLSPFTPQEINGKAGLFRAACLTPLGGHRLLATICLRRPTR